LAHKLEESTRTNSDDGQATRLALIDASLAMFSQRGFESTTLGALASSIGVTTGAVYGNFESKQDLFVSAALHARRQVERAVLLGQPSTGDLADRAAAYIQAVATLGTQQPSLIAFRVIVPLELARNAELREALDDEHSSRVELCQRIMARRPNGRTAPLTRRGRELANTILALGDGIAALLQVDPGIVPYKPKDAAAFISALLQGRLFAA
jgi:AcrR family transcriptional regulator